MLTEPSLPEEYDASPSKQFLLSRTETLEKDRGGGVGDCYRNLKYSAASLSTGVRQSEFYVSNLL